MDSAAAAGALYVMDDCAAATWPDHDGSGMCGRNEHRSHGNCVGNDCEPLEREFTWPLDIDGEAATPTRVFLVVDQVGGDSAESFQLDWGFVSPGRQ